MTPCDFLNRPSGEPPPDQLGLPEMVFIVTDTFLVFDHRFRRLKIFANALVEGTKIDEAYDAGRAKNPADRRQARGADQTAPDERRARLRFRSARRAIPRGRSFTRWFAGRNDTSKPGTSFRWFLHSGLKPDLRETRSLFIERSDSSIPLLICSACGLENVLPWSAVHRKSTSGCGGEASRFVPIAGTRKRGATSAEDEQLARRTAGRPEGTGGASDAGRSGEK